MSESEPSSNESRSPTRGEIRFNDSDNSISIWNDTNWVPLGSRQAFGNTVEIMAFLARNGETVIESTTENQNLGRERLTFKTRTPQGIEIHREAVMAYGGFYFTNVRITVENQQVEALQALGVRTGPRRTIRLNSNGNILRTTPRSHPTSNSIGTWENRRLPGDLHEIPALGGAIVTNPFFKPHRNFSGVFDINDDKELREFQDSKGLFKRGVKKFLPLPMEEQVKKINSMVKVYEFDENKHVTKLDLGWAGRYDVRLSEPPMGERIEKFNKKSDRNPFLNNGNMCLGNMKETYTRCIANNNYLEALKIIIAVLQSKNDLHGYKRWSGCKLRMWSSKRY